MRDDLYAIRPTVFQVGLDVGTEEITEVVPTIRACVVFLFDKPVHDPCDAQAIRVNCMPTFTLHFSSVEFNNSVPEPHSNFPFCSIVLISVRSAASEFLSFLFLLVKMPLLVQSCLSSVI